MSFPKMNLRPPKKAIRLHLEPQEAFALYVFLEQAVSFLDKRPADAELAQLMENVSGKLYDRLEATFDDA